MARYLGALERSTPETVSKIVYGDTEYKWDSVANLKGSNWKSAGGKTLVDAITATGTQQVSKVELKLVDANDYSIDVVFQVTQ